jgi:hypothetical protein
VPGNWLNDTCTNLIGNFPAAGNQLQTLTAPPEGLSFLLGGFDGPPRAPSTSAFVSRLQGSFDEGDVEVVEEAVAPVGVDEEPPLLLDLLPQPARANADASTATQTAGVLIDPAIR